MSFETALASTLRFEGGYANSSKDSGGETYRGISRKANPDWEGWQTIDAIKRALVDKGVAKSFVDSKAAWKEVDKIAETHYMLISSVNELYHDNYYVPLLKYNFPQRLRDKMFDIRVNMSPKSGNMILQRALAASGQPVSVDGIIGPKTLAAVAKAELGALLKNVCAAQFKHYEATVLLTFPNSRAHFKERADWLPKEDRPENIGMAPAVYLNV